MPRRPPERVPKNACATTQSATMWPSLRALVQLDLFGSAAPHQPLSTPGPATSAPTSQPGPADTPPASPHRTPVLSPRSPSRPAPPPASPPASAPTVGPFQHAHANREAVLGGQRVAYLLKRAARRSIGFTIRPEGLVVSAPTWVALRDIDAALRDKAGWILDKLQQVQQHRPPAPQWHEGAALPYLGGTLQLVLPPVTAAQARSRREPGEQIGRQLHLHLPPAPSPQQIALRAQAWLVQQAHPLFEQRLNHYAPLLGVRWTALTLSQARTRWGSATSNGSIRLNWRLVQLPLHLIDYVVVHELSHLREMNHSPRFWAIVASVFPHYQSLRRELRQQAMVGQE